MRRHLLSAIGRGKRDQNNPNVYETTSYCFPDGKRIARAVFFEALVTHESFKPDEATLVGTATSAWSALLDSLLEEEQDAGLIDFYDKIEQQCGNDGLEPAERIELERILAKKYGIPIHVKIVGHEFTEANGFQIMGAFTAALDTIDTGRDTEIVWDITHGFRTMPFMIEAALDYRKALGFTNTLRIVYGELQGAGRATVRDLSILKDYTELTWALQLFLEKYDGTDLIRWIKDHKDSEKPDRYDSLSSAIHDFSGMIQTGAFFAMDLRLRQLKNALDKIDLDTGHDGWFIGVYQALRTLQKELTTKSIPEGILRLAQRMWDARMYSTAVLATQAAGELFAVQRINPASKNFQYDMMKQAYYDLLQREVSWDLKSNLENLRSLRNSIAHGGVGESENAKLLSQQSVRDRARNGIQAMQRLLQMDG